MTELDAITSSGDLNSELAARAASSSQQLKILIARVAEIANPEEGWTRLFKVIVAASKADWVEGELQVDLRAEDNNTTTLAFYSVLGVGIRERLFSPYTLNVPIDEFQRAILITPEIIAPMRAHQGREKLTLTAGMRVRNQDIPDFELEEKAKGDGERITAPPPPGDGGITAPPPPELEIAEPDEHTRSTVPPPDMPDLIISDDDAG